MKYRKKPVVYVCETYEWSMREYENARADKGMMSNYYSYCGRYRRNLGEIGTKAVRNEQGRSGTGDR